ncbi:ribokinase [Rhodococcus marinonascens]|uniref:ribokinase n=1 Tax=Rhodococcus marinonascens TaxID=38311 RepID=UPI000932CD4C|nr:ribokinase [Rhodococcus marinonascens]
MSTIFVVGSLNIDQTIRVRALPRGGETVRGSDAVYGPGGKGGNQAVAAARAGAAVAFTGAVGDDAHGRRILEILSGAGVDCRHIRVVDAVPTGTAVIAVDDEGQNQILVSPGANSSLTTEDMDIAEAREGDILVLQLEIPATLVRRAARSAKSRGLFVVLNAAPAPLQIEELFDDVDLLVVNEQEISLVADLTGIPASDPLDLVRLLPAVLGPAIVYTAGAEGSFTVLGDNLVHVPALTVITKDTTGAGDTFVGYLAASLLADPGDLVTAMKLATRASALAVARSGAMESIPHREEVLQAPDSPSTPPPQGDS